MTTPHPGRKETPEGENNAYYGQGLDKQILISSGQVPEKSSHTYANRDPQYHGKQKLEPTDSPAVREKCASYFFHKRTIKGALKKTETLIFVG